MSNFWGSHQGPGGLEDGSLWRACPDTVSHTFLPYYVPAWAHRRTGGHSLNQTHWAGQLCWTAGCG